MKKITKQRILATFGIFMSLFATSPGLVLGSESEIVAPIVPRAAFTLSEYQGKTLGFEYPTALGREPVRTQGIIATAYSSDPYQTDDTPCLPAVNYDLCEAAERGEVNTIAANFLPKGTQVRFPELYGDKVFVVRDRMNARYNGTNRVDFYTAMLDARGKLDDAASKQAAKQFGLKRMTMEVYGK